MNTEEIREAYRRPPASTRANRPLRYTGHRQLGGCEVCGGTRERNELYFIYPAGRPTRACRTCAEASLERALNRTAKEGA